MDEYITIGKVGKTHGKAGALKLRVEERYESSVLQASVLFVPVAGRPAPFFVESYLSEAPLIVKLEEIDNKEDAQPLCGQNLMLRQQDVELEEEEEADFTEMIGYTIHDEEAGEVGIIKDVIELPEQIMAVVDYEDREILIPINEYFLRSFDPDQKLIFMALPEGLLDL
jgi:16S rRNA processing protein RimM